jgi:hypothetical protein
MGAGWKPTLNGDHRNETGNGAFALAAVSTGNWFARRRYVFTWVFTEETMTNVAEAGGENLGRLKSRLRRNPQALAALRGLGLGGALVDRLHLGLKEPYRSRIDGLEVEDALCFPLLGDGMRPLGRYAYVNIPQVTVNPVSQTSWGPGPSQIYRLGSFAADADAFVAFEPMDCWLAWQLAGGSQPAATFIARSHAQGWPAEWSSPGFWSRFRRIVLLPSPGLADFEQRIGPKIGRTLEKLNLPAQFDTLGQLTRAPDGPSFDELLASAKPIVGVVVRGVADVPDDALGAFAAAPVRVAGAFVNGFSYYPFAIESRELETVDAATRGRMVHSYSTMIVRSDGHVLSTEVLPAPRGTPADQRILALSDGTRIVSEPIASRTGTWSFAAIQRFVDWRLKGAKPPFRHLSNMLTDLEAHISACVWLPVPGQALLAAIYIVLSHVFQVFDAIPLLLVTGPAGTGKSELGEAIGRLSFNATIAGQLRAAGMIRLLDETRGTIVLDDMDGDGPASVTGTGELAQALKTSYKRSTSVKPVADRGGRVRMIDFYGPKVIGNTRGVDQVLGARMFRVITAQAPDGWSATGALADEPALNSLRDELHAWGMASSRELHEIYRNADRRRTDRRTEISTPMLCIAKMAGEGVADRLNVAMDDPRSNPLCVEGLRAD